MTAFGSALLESLHGAHQYFDMEVDGYSARMPCRHFMEIMPAEGELLGNLIEGENSAILDWGCGCGRHLRFLTDNFPGVTAVGVEQCEGLVTYCQESFLAAHYFQAASPSFSETLQGLPIQEFDGILLMGNGLGVLGNEGQCRENIKLLMDCLKPGGKLLLETGLPMGGAGFRETTLTIHWRELTDGPFTWGQCDQGWIRMICHENGWEPVFHASAQPGFFCCVISHRPPILNI